ncbi:hypothetical protein LWI29_025205 [Acer saccharum]|uniref:Uncharacterized protein n=1 Tax=Acer saccharum TaxID=4024 RepID=A0AA39VZZ5_ACESA|nr:hypothetical protein LWI29_025205 [Acer saccharum]
METSLGVWLAWVVGVVPILGLLLWCWNELWYAVPLKFRYSGTGTRLPPGHMGSRFLERRSHFFGTSKFSAAQTNSSILNVERMYRTLLGSPSVIVCFPSISKNCISVDEILRLQWQPLTGGRTSLVSVHGKAHETAQKLCNQSLTVTFENIGKLFVSFESGLVWKAWKNYFRGYLKEFELIHSTFLELLITMPVRKKLEAIFRVELEKKKNRTRIDQTTNIDLMDGLMQVEDDIGKRLSDQEVLDNIVSLVVAGYTSTAMASTWALYFLAKYPNVLEKLRVVEETIRMANISGFTFRLASREVEYEGYKIPKDWKVIVWNRYLHTNPENFNDPMCFNPDRWNEPASPGTYQAFGGGSRICAGNMLARLQIALLLHHLSVGYK